MPRKRRPAKRDGEKLRCPECNAKLGHFTPTELVLDESLYLIEGDYEFWQQLQLLDDGEIRVNEVTLRFGSTERARADAPLPKRRLRPATRKKVAGRESFGLLTEPTDHPVHLPRPCRHPLEIYCPNSGHLVSVGAGT